MEQALEKFKQDIKAFNAKKKPNLTPMPPLRAQAGNAVAAAGRAAGHLLSGNAVLVSPEELERRLALCRACDQYRDGRCLRCGCVIRFKARLESETGQCPLKKW